MAFLGMATSVATTAAAQVPALVPVQGVLYDSAGAPVDEPVSVTFSLYDSSLGGTRLWNDTLLVDAEAGLFAIYLGQGAAPLPPSLFSQNPTVWLGLSVDGDPELERMQIATAPFAAYAGYSDVAGELVPDERASIVSDTLDDAAALFSPVGHDHAWSELTSVPAGFADNIDNVLTEAEVDAFADNNGYLTSSSNVAWSNLSGIPAGFADGVDNDTLSILNCPNNQILRRFGPSWICSVEDGDVSSVAAGAGLSGGGDSGDVTIEFSPTVSNEFLATVIGEGGVNSGTDMTNVSNSFCFLTRVRITDDSDEDDASRCGIFIVGSVWRLDAFTTADEAGNTECAARCISW
jgi:hypothetical protein